MYTKSLSAETWLEVLVIRDTNTGVKYVTGLDLVALEYSFWCELKNLKRNSGPEENIQNRPW